MTLVDPRTGIPVFETGADTFDPIDWSQKIAAAVGSRYGLYSEGLRAARPAPGVARRLYLATDETPGPVLYRDTGPMTSPAVASWQRLSTGGDIPPTSWSTGVASNGTPWNLNAQDGSYSRSNGWVSAWSLSRNGDNGPAGGGAAAYLNLPGGFLPTDNEQFFGEWWYLESNDNHIISGVLRRPLGVTTPFAITYRDNAGGGVQAALPTSYQRTLHTRWHYQSVL